MHSHDKQKIGIVLSGFPRLSETFILHELLEFERQGLEPIIFPLKSGQQGPLPREIQFLRSPLAYLPQRFSLAFVRETLQSLKTLFHENAAATLKIISMFLITGKKEKEFHRLKSLLRLLWFCRKLRETGVTRLHAHFAHDPTTMAWWAARLLDIPYSFTAHAKDIYCYSQKWLARKLHDAEFVVTCTDYNRKYLERISPNGTPIHCLYHGIDLQKFAPKPEIPNSKSQIPKSLPKEQGFENVNTKLSFEGGLQDSPPEASPLYSPLEGGQGGVKDEVRSTRFSVEDSSLKAEHRASDKNSLKAEHPNTPLLLAVGRLVEKKGFSYLIDACRILKDEGLVFRCEIAGDGPLRTQLRTQVRHCGLENIVILRGALPPAEIKMLYTKATLFVLPSFITQSGDRDGIPNVILEAMAMQMPVVSTRVSGIPEAVVHGETGLLVPEKDACALAVEIKKLLSNPDQREQFGKAARERVKRYFTLEANVKQKMELMLG